MTDHGLHLYSFYYISIIRSISIGEFSVAKSSYLYYTSCKKLIKHYTIM